MRRHRDAIHVYPVYPCISSLYVCVSFVYFPCVFLPVFSACVSLSLCMSLSLSVHKANSDSNNSDDKDNTGARQRAASESEGAAFPLIFIMFGGKYC